MKISANLTLLFTERPLIERIVAASAAGFDGVEIQFPYEIPAIRLKEALQAAGMPLRLINLPAGDFMSGGPGIAAVPERQAEFDKALEQALTYATMVRPACVNVLPGRLVDGLPRDVAMTTLANNLRQTAEAFELLGIRVLCEALNPLDMPGVWLCTPADLDALLRQVDHPNCQAQYDLYHMARQEVDIVAGIRSLAGRIGHVQFADCPGRNEPGSASVDFSAALQALDAAGYKGWIGAEYRPLTVTEDGLSWLPAWQADYARLCR